jgi:hypothetical protein
LAANQLPEDFTGRRYGLWTVLAFALSRRGASHWACRCDCGTERVVWGAALKRGGTTGCGCTRVLSNFRHGHTQAGGGKSPEYRSWDKMIQRCTNPNHASYPNYGARGITVCDKWRDYAAFFADMGPKPPGRYSIERVDNERGYSKDNCIWATQQAQLENRRNTIFVEFNGERMLLTEACRKAGVPYDTAFARRAKCLPESQWFLPASR